MAAERKVKLAGWGNYPISESISLFPRVEQDLKTDLKKTPLIARGLGRSYGDQAINDDRYVAICTKLNHFL
jgi:FAD/FMN-containing dehydrogenase